MIQDLALLILLLISTSLLYWRIRRLEKAKQAEPKETPNEVIKKPEETTAFEENNPWTIPQDVKIEVEGGDSLVPPGYAE